MTLRYEAYYSGEDLVRPATPKRPYLTKSATAVEVRLYADQLEVYESAMVGYDLAIAEWRKNKSVRFADLLVDLAASSGLSLAKTTVLYNKAYEDGHSGGLGEVINNFHDLVDLVTRFNDAD